jgi:fumarate reductase subunit D
MGVCWSIYGQCTILSAILGAVIVIGLLLKMGVVLGRIACRLGKAIVLDEFEDNYQ